MLHYLAGGPDGVVVIRAGQLACRICPGAGGEIWKLVAGLIRHVRPWESVTV
ncbi:hypothetical protein ACN6LL_007631 [Streptomyces violaceoruber]